MRGRYSKPALDHQSLIAKLQGRGLVINDLPAAIRLLDHIGYYRLSAYAYPFQEVNLPRKPFRAGTTIEDVEKLYLFDRKLRLLVMDAIERIEVATRSCITTEMSLADGPHWFLNQRHFRPRFDHQKFIDKIRRDVHMQRSEEFIQHYQTNYSTPDLPPSWVISEILSMGTVSRVYGALVDRGKRGQIARRLGIGPLQMESWLHSLTYTRNVCAHHSRLWNRAFSISPVIGNRMPPLPNSMRFYAVAAVIWEMLREIDPDTQWNQHLTDLLAAHPSTDLAAMGFPANWKDEAFWDLTSASSNGGTNP